ncbi:MAG: right-handed parallel beta-helix repeat-containing protein [Eubacteriales bacterium]|nr:right-handed parallel beta-helix repeat-containing protein [Eubacteriales bacterium]
MGEPESSGVPFIDGEGREEVFGAGEDIFSEGELLPEENQEPVQEATELTLSAREGDDITVSLNLLLAEAGRKATAKAPCKVIIPPGHYRLTGTICMYSNIHLYAAGAVITKTSKDKHLLLRLGIWEESAGGYDGYSNITIEGGTWDCNYDSCEDKEEEGGFVGFRIGHANHVLIKDVTFLNNLKSHFLEFGGVRDARVTGCTFKGYWAPYEEGGQECIQIDACRDIIFPMYQPYDGTVCENIIIEGNLFEDVFAGVGSHSMMFDKPYKNIFIQNNTFRNIKKRAVWCLNYQDSAVKDNIMENVGGGVYVRSLYSHNAHVMEGQQTDVSQNQQDEDLVISNNKISVAVPGSVAGSFWRSYGIQVVGEHNSKTDSVIPAGLYFVRGVTVTGNSVTGPGNGIRLDLARDCTVTNNKVSLSKAPGFENMGIYLGASSGNFIQGNKVENAENAGIYVYKGNSAYKSASENNALTGNVVTGCGSDGVLIDSTSNHTSLIKNVSSDNGGSGIAVYRSILDSLDQNEAFSNQKYGIYAYHADIKDQKENKMQDNRGAYAMYMNGCKGKGQTIKSMKVSAVTEKSVKVTGQIAGGKTILISHQKNNTILGKAKINGKGQYIVPIKKQKKGSVLVLAATDRYQNCVTATKTVTAAPKSTPAPKKE